MSIREEASGRPEGGNGPVEAPPALSAQEMRALCGPLLEGHAAVGEAVDRERMLAWRLAGAVAVMLLGVSLLTAVVRGPPPLAADVAWAVVLGLFGLLLVAPRQLTSGVHRWIRPNESFGTPVASDSAILYDAVRSVHRAAESAERLWAAVIVLGVLLAPIAGAFGFVLTIDLLLVAVPGWLTGAGAAAPLLLLVVSGTAVGLTLAWVVRRLGHLERLRGILAAQLAGLERLEVALWMRF